MSDFFKKTMLFAAAILLSVPQVHSSDLETIAVREAESLISKSLMTGLSANGMTPSEIVALIRNERAITLTHESGTIEVRRRSDERGLVVSTRNSNGDIVDARTIVTPENASPREAADYLSMSLRSMTLSVVAQPSRDIAQAQIISPPSQRTISPFVGILGVLAAFSCFDEFGDDGNIKRGIAILVAAGAIISADYFIFN